MKRFVLIMAALALLSGSVGEAKADPQLTITGYNGQGVNMLDGATLVGSGPVGQSGTGTLIDGGPVGGGLLFGTLDGNTLHNFYCVEIFTTIGVPGTYNSLPTLNGIVHGTLVPNAGEISWLMTNTAPGISSSDLNAQNGLQAAIWYLANLGTANPVTLSSNNSATVIADYTNDLSAAAGKTDPVSNVLWLSNYNGNGSAAQGLISTDANLATPEPASLTLLGIGLGCIVGYGWRRRRLAVS